MPKEEPLPKRFPGQHCIRSTLWVPNKAGTRHAHRIQFEGRLHPAVADAILALQLHQGHITPEMIAELKTMTDTLREDCKG